MKSLDDMESAWTCVFTNKPTCTTWGKPPQSAICGKRWSVSLIHYFYGKFVIHPFNKRNTESLTFSSVVLVGFNLELHSTWQINERLILSSTVNSLQSFLLALLRWWSVTHHSLHSRWCVTNHEQSRAPRLGKRWAVYILKTVQTGTNVFIWVFLVYKPTLACWLCPHSDRQLAFRSPGPDGWWRETNCDELLELEQFDLANCKVTWQKSWFSARIMI